MEKTLRILFMLFITASIISCGGKKDKGDIIAPKPVEHHSNTILSMQGYQSTSMQSWAGSTYKISLKRYVDKSLPTTKDENDQKYYDNKIDLVISHSDGSTFFKKTFTKSDFSQYLDKSVTSEGALLGVVFDKIEGDNLIFGASVGSPDKTSDEYIPMVVKISKSGSLSITKDTQLDTSSDVTEEQDDSN